MPLIYPDAPHPLIMRVLGTPNFITGPIAYVYRAAGHDIPTKMEAEQAFVLDKMIRAVLVYGDGWETAFNADFALARAEAKRRADEVTRQKVIDRLDE